MEKPESMMRSETQECETAALENALRTAVRRHRAALAAQDDRRRQGFELRFLLARLGFGTADLDAVCAAASAAALPRHLQGEIARRLGVEAARLKRLAWSASPRYDFNRHLAVRRALLWAGGKAEDPRCLPIPPRAAPAHPPRRTRRLRPSGGAEARGQPPHALGTLP